MRKYLFLLFLSALWVLAFTSCSGDDESGTDDGGEKTQTEETIAEKLVGEWICYYQYWEESGYREEAYYNTDDLSLTFYEDFSAYLKREGKDELLEIGSSQDFTYAVIDKEKAIYAYIYNEAYRWNVTSLTEAELEIKWQDGDYIIIAKFTKRAKLTDKVAALSYKTEYAGGAGSSYQTYSFSYNFKGEIDGITCNNDKLTYEPRQDNEMYMNWYNGDRLKLVDNREKGYAEVSFNNTSVAYAEYDKNGQLTSTEGVNKSQKYEYKNGNLSSVEAWSGVHLVYKYGYEYAFEKNEANIDLNYFIDPDAISEGNSYSCGNYWELGLAGQKSRNLISKITTPDDYDFYYTYMYKKDAKGRISEITRTCVNRFDSNDWLNKCTISVRYHNE